MNTPNPKRPCHEIPSHPSSIQNPNYSHDDLTISSFITLPDSPSFSSCSFDRVLEQFFSSASKSSGDDSLHDQLFDRTRKLALRLLEFNERCSRKRALAHNYNSWRLPHELTVKVFTMLDTKTRMQASACCTMFNKCALDPLCYSNIDLTITRKRINSEFLCSKISRAGNQLRSLKLGRVTREAIPMLTQSCLASKFLGHGFTGNLLKSLHFYNCDLTCTKSLCNVLPAFPNLTDRKIVKFDKKCILEQVSKSLIRTNRLIKHLYLESQKLLSYLSGISSLKSQEFIISCPNLTSLTLIGFCIKEETAQTIAMGFPKLHYLNLSKTPRLTGRFLSEAGKGCRENNPLKTLILRDCYSLDMKEMSQFWNSLIIGEYRFIRHIDVSNEYDTDWIKGHERFSIPKKLKQERSDVTVYNR